MRPEPDKAARDFGNVRPPSRFKDQAHAGSHAPDISRRRVRGNCGADHRPDPDGTQAVGTLRSATGLEAFQAVR